MATITLYSGKINQMPNLIKAAKQSVEKFKSELSDLQKKANKVDSGVCDLSEVISSIQASAQTQENRIESLDNFQTKSEDFINDTVSIDNKVAETVNQNKKDFYEEYDYLKPDCEKSGWEKFCDAMADVGEWCKKNWESLVSVILVVIAAIAVVALCIVSFGTALPVLVALAVGAVVGLLSQLASDLVSFAITGEWSGTWGSYIGAMVGGGIGGVVLIWSHGNATLASAVDSGISTFLGQHLENLFGENKRSSLEIALNTTVDAFLAALFSKGLEKASQKLSKLISKKFWNFRPLGRLAGPGNYDASFRAMLTRLINGDKVTPTWKTFRNGIVGGLAGSFFENIFDGVKSGVVSLFGE